LNLEVEDEAQFREDVKAICKVYHQAQERHDQGIHVISVDEKTGIQALERIHPTQPVKEGQVERVEFEYKRHGTQALIANFEVATGKVIFPTVQETRTEADFLAHIQQLVNSDPQGQWIFVADQLNTHKSASLVKWIAEQCGIEDELGEKGKEGVLQNMSSRAEFLQTESHRIRFIYTPKHCSWLNQVEIWFGILSRRLLKRGQFTSTDELRDRILKFITFFNETLAKPFRWTYIGKPLMA
jgi:transposase